MECLMELKQSEMLRIFVAEQTRYGHHPLYEEIVREAVKLIKVTYEVLKPVTDPHEAIKPRALKVHPDRNNLLETCRVFRGGIADEILAASDFVAKGIYQTQRIEHAFLETEGAVAMPFEEGVHLYSNGQGIYEDRKQVAAIYFQGFHRVRPFLTIELSK